VYTFSNHCYTLLELSFDKLIQIPLHPIWVFYWECVFFRAFRIPVEPKLLLSILSVLKPKTEQLKSINYIMYRLRWDQLYFLSFLASGQMLLHEFGKTTLSGKLHPTNQYYKWRINAILGFEFGGRFYFIYSLGLLLQNFVGVFWKFFVFLYHQLFYYSVCVYWRFFLFFHGSPYHLIDCLCFKPHLQGLL